MKKTDIALVIFIAAISIVIAYFVAKAVLGDPGEQVVVVKTARPISSEVAAPSKYIFNDDAINPTVEICIGEGSGDCTSGDSSSSSSEEATNDATEGDEDQLQSGSESSTNGGQGANPQNP